jgi:hypothetical protein
MDKRGTIWSLLSLLIWVKSGLPNPECSLIIPAGAQLFGILGQHAVGKLQGKGSVKMLNEIMFEALTSTIRIDHKSGLVHSSTPFLQSEQDST